jgi:hypothetical protein
MPRPQDTGTAMGSDDLKRELALADLIRDLAYAQETRKKLFAAIVRLVQRREAKGPSGDVMEQIRRDKKLCKLLVDYEDRSEIIGMLDFVRELKTCPSLCECSSDAKRFARYAIARNILRR